MHEIETLMMETKGCIALVTGGGWHLFVSPIDDNSGDCVCFDGTTSIRGFQCSPLTVQANGMR